MQSSEAVVQDTMDKPACQSCGRAGLEETLVQSAFWEGERLVVVEDIPALVCRGCGERFYDDETAIRLDMLRGTGFPAARAARQMNVEVFRLPGSGSRGDG